MRGHDRVGWRFVEVEYITKALVSNISAIADDPHPRCVCDSDMCLTCIEPDGFGHDRRIFECPRCKHWTVEIIGIEHE